MITNEPIENTPFRLVGSPSKGYFIAMGDYRLTEPQRTQRKALQYVEEHHWEIIANMIIIMPSMLNKASQIQQTPNQKLA